MRPNFLTSKNITRWAIRIGIIIAFIAMLQWLIQKMIYPAPFMGVSSPPAPMKEIHIPFNAKEATIGWLYHKPDAGESTPVFLFFHGNGENLQTMHYAEYSKIFKDLACPTWRLITRAMGKAMVPHRKRPY